MCELHESGRPRLGVLESLGAAKPKWQRWEPLVGICGSLASGKDCKLDDLANPRPLERRGQLCGDGRRLALRPPWETSGDYATASGSATAPKQAVQLHCTSPVTNSPQVFFGSLLALS